MEIQIVFVATFDAEHIELSNHLPKPRILEDYPDSPIPVKQGYSLTRLRIEAEDPPVLPTGDLTQEQYRQWRSRLGEASIVEEQVDQKLVRIGLAGLCVEVRLSPVETEQYGVLMETAVKNIGPYPIGKMKVMWEGQWSATAGRQDIGSGYEFVAVGDNPRQLHPGDSRLFALMKPALGAGLSYAASLPPDQHQIVVRATLPDHEAMYDIYRIPGTEFVDLVETLEELLEAE